MELLIVVALLGALATLMLPNFKVKKKHSYRTIMISEMHEIQRAFMRFDHDCMPSNEMLEKMTNVSFALLFDREVKNSTPSTYLSCTAYNPDANIGWEGPYAISEGELTNTIDGESYVVNAFFDPYGQPYRIVKSNDVFWLVATTNSTQPELLSRQLTFED